jgi:hypothetical protein
MEEKDYVRLIDKGVLVVEMIPPSTAEAFKLKDENVVVVSPKLLEKIYPVVEELLSERVQANFKHKRELLENRIQLLAYSHQTTIDKYKEELDEMAVTVKLNDYLYKIERGGGNWAKYLIHSQEIFNYLDFELLSENQYPIKSLGLNKKVVELAQFKATLLLIQYVKSKIQELEVSKNPSLKEGHLQLNLPAEKVNELFKSTKGSVFTNEISIDTFQDVFSNNPTTSVPVKNIRMLSYLLHSLNYHRFILENDWQSIAEKKGLFKSKHGKTITANSLSVALFSALNGNKKKYITELDELIKKLKS